ncbi:HU family DNA-binding protein [Acidovorax sp. SUPP3334]|uniref:HU family DNA-binding protein n=1 Tax=Acidovorax sp. SUPP3334 TaxID=2920881 RepID=UPI0023DE1CE1|nr:HU family DNA-binding protein [Acidovorax sp. SUPP3334]GKT21710.1 HU family DNA-binding protein [Acidovorax sp. SUPP3334]
MNKTELIENVADQAGITKVAAGAALEAALASIRDTLKRGDSVTLVGFGSFSVTKRAARMGRNPKTGEALKIKASMAPKFTAGKPLKDALN